MTAARDALYRLWKPGDSAGYIRSEIPVFESPHYRGERYESFVPDTLDLAERARLTVHALTEVADPQADYEVYFHVRFRSNPPMMGHDWVCTSMRPKFEQAVSLMRMMCGSEENTHVDRRWMEVGLHMQGPDGLLHTPVRGRPWAYPDSSFPWAPAPGAEHWVEPFINGRALSAMVLHWLRDGARAWKDAACRLVDGLVDLAIDDPERGAFFWPAQFHATKDHPPNVEPPAMRMENEGFVPLGLIHAYRYLDYEPALPLAGRLIHYYSNAFYGADGTFLNKPGDATGAHFHSHTSGLMAMCEYALAADDSGMMERVLAGYEFARRCGNTVLGYFPEWSNSERFQTSEICEVSDMVSLALRLSELGVGDFWDDADRWLRNLLTEGQLLSTDWIDRLADHGWHEPWEPTPSEYDRVSQTTDRVAERNLGAFAGWPSANDWYTGMGSGIQHCCTANGARSLFMIWNRIATRQDGTLRVNLLLNRASRWADIDSYIPYQGRVVIRVKEPLDLEVRIPEWVSPGETRADVGESDRRIEWRGRYACLGQVRPGDVVSVHFPIQERMDEIHVEKRRYRIVRRGNEVVSIDPPGTVWPLYQRQHYRSHRPRWRQVTHFASDDQIDWV